MRLTPFSQQVSKHMLKKLLDQTLYLKDNHPFRLILLIFALSALYLTILNSVELAAGIDKRFHIDSQTYSSDKARAACEQVFEHGRTLINRGYYCTSYLLGPDLAILLNALAYCIATTLMVSALLRSKSTPLVTVLILCLILAPYRAHLGIHLLKDSLISLFVALAFFWRGGMIWLFPITLFRGAASVIYFPALFSLRSLILVGTIITAGTFIVFFDTMMHWISLLEGGNKTQFVFQTYDKVPTFQEYNVWGDVIRSLIWPLFILTGVFFVFSPAPLFFPIAAAGFVTAATLILNRKHINWEKVAVIYLSIGIIAYMAPGFTGFTRYSYPLATVVMVSALIGQPSIRLSDWLKHFRNIKRA